MKRNVIIPVIMIVFIMVVALSGIFVWRRQENDKSRPAPQKPEAQEGTANDYEELSGEQLEIMAYDGDAEAQYRLAQIYDYGLQDVGQNFQTAYKWYKAAAEQNHAKAWCALGYLYMNGLVSPEPEGETPADSMEEAFRCFHQSIALGCKEGYIGEGRLYLQGYGEESVRAQEAFRCFSTTAEEGLCEGLYYLGYAYEQGIGVEADVAKAMEYYRQAAQMQDYDFTEAYAVAGANVRMGIVYANGTGVEQDDKTAFQCFRTAADMDDAKGLYYTGVMYLNGCGTSVDYRKAMNMFLAAAKSEYAPALNQIGYLYYNGYGVDVDYQQAVYYQKMAAMQGYAPAQINLGYLYEHGFGVEQSNQMALAYYRLAAAQNYQGAREAVARVQKEDR